MKTSELTGPKLAHFVALAEGLALNIVSYAEERILSVYDGDTFIGYIGGTDTPQYAPHEDWSQGGPIIERDRISVCFLRNLHTKTNAWAAQIHSDAYGEDTIGLIDRWGSTPLIAAARCYVASKFGDEVANA